MKKNKDYGDEMRRNLPKIVGIIVAYIVAMYNKTKPDTVPEFFDMMLPLLVVLLCFAPIYVVNMYDIKVKKPKNIYYEDSVVKVGLMLVSWAVLTMAAITLVGYLLPHEPDIDTYFERNSNMFMAVWIAVGIVIPINAYIINYSVRYKRVVKRGDPDYKGSKIVKRVKVK